MTAPRVSVVMPVYNRAQYIKSAIESILMQTYTDFEFIIVDDGSTDGTVEIIKSYDDLRIRLIQHKKNKGVAVARNTGYRNAKGEFIVIADSDDINLPNKLASQVDYLDNNKDISVVGCNYKLFNSTGFINKWIYFEKDEEIRCAMIFWPGLPAASMFRVKEIKEQNLLYHDENYAASVDYEWYAKMPKYIKFANIAECLYLYRIHDKQITTNNSVEQIYFAKQVRKKLLIQLGLNVTDYEKKVHNVLCDFNVFCDFDVLYPDSFYKIRSWVETLISCNKTVGIYNESFFTKLLAQKFYGLCNTYSYLGEKVWREWESFKYNCFSDELVINFNNRKIKKMVSGNIAIFGTKRSAVLLLNELSKKNIKVNNFIDNNIDTSNFFINSIPVYKEKYLDDNIVIDTLIISVMADYKFFLKEKLMIKYPQIKILLIDELTV